jgi:hypothetical protein
MSTSEVITLGSGASPVRLSFARLFNPKSFQEGQPPRYEATFLLDPSNKEHAAVIAKIKETAKALLTEHFGGEIPKGVKPCYGSGDEKEYDGYEGMFYISTSNRSRPTVVDRQRNPLAEADGKPYSGSYVIGSITLWVMDNKFGKRVNANLRAVQFVKDGEAFGVKPVDAEDEFEALPDDVDTSSEPNGNVAVAASADKEDWE